MVNRFFIEKINENFPYSFTNDQQKALDKIVDFLFSGIVDQLFLLTGYAGTGKSSLIGSLVRTMTQFRQKTILLAPTAARQRCFQAMPRNKPTPFIRRFIASKSSPKELPTSRWPKICTNIHCSL